MIKLVQTADRQKVVQKTYYYGFNGCNQIVHYAGIPESLRGRVETLILDETRSKVLICPAIKGTIYEYFGYRLPGGTNEKDILPKQIAIQEAAEEARIIICDAFDSGISYLYTYDNPPEWVMEKIPKDHWWYGSYVDVFVGVYAGRYHGYVEPIHTDVDMYNNAVWVDIDDHRLIEWHKDAIRACLQAAEMR